MGKQSGWELQSFTADATTPAAGRQAGLEAAGSMAVACAARIFGHRLADTRMGGIRA
jgi:hypothetical protein